MKLPEEYVIQKFCQYCKDPKHNKHANTYQGGCPICNEGKSLGRKRRAYYIIEENVICCHNCSWYSDPLSWIKEVTGDNISEILKEAQDYDLLPLNFNEKKVKTPPKKQPSLPYDSINLFDPTQLDFYKGNKVIQTALELIKNRRIDTAVNKPKTLWISLKDLTHANRLVIPFYDQQNNIIFYQTRTILSSDSHMEKYLSKGNSDKSLYGLNNVDLSLNHLFLLEGPINAFFVKNGTAVCGIQKGYSNLTSLQEKQLSNFPTLKKIWILDSQWVDDTSFEKSEKLIKMGDSIFIWPENVGKKFKDFNDLAIQFKIDEISEKFILENTYSGLAARLKMSEISRWKKSNNP